MLKINVIKKSLVQVYIAYLQMSQEIMVFLIVLNNQSTIQRSTWSEPVSKVMRVNKSNFKIAFK